MTLDDRGRRAAQNLKKKVDEAPLLLLERGVPGARMPDRQSRLLSFAGAFAAVVLLVGLTLVQVDLFAPQRETSTTSDTFPVNTVPTTETTDSSPTTTAGSQLSNRCVTRPRNAAVYASIVNSGRLLTNNGLRGTAKIAGQTSTLTRSQPVLRTGFERQAATYRSASRIPARKWSIVPSSDSATCGG